MSSANRNFYLSFPAWISFSSLTAVTRISNNMLNKSGKNEHLCLVPVRGNAFNFSLLNMMLATGLSYMIFIMLRYIPSMGFPCGSDGEESACNAGDLASNPGLGRSPGGGHGNPLQYSGLENSMDRGAWQAKSLKLQRVRHNWVTKNIHIFPLCPICWKYSSQMDAEFCRKLFLHLLRWAHGFIFSLLIWFIVVTDSHVLNYPCIPGKTPHTMMVSNLFNSSLSSIC